MCACVCVYVCTYAGGVKGQYHREQQHRIIIIKIILIRLIFNYSTLKNGEKIGHYLVKDFVTFSSVLFIFAFSPSYPSSISASLGMTSEGCCTNTSLHEKVTLLRVSS